MIVVTGLSGVGKTTIVKALNYKNTIYVDELVKNVFYKRNFKLYWEIKDAFGKEYVGFNKVKTNKLGKLVFTNPKKLEILNNLVRPYLQTYFEILKTTGENYLVDMAIYMNDEKSFKKYFNKVVIIDRQYNLDDKFKYLDVKKQPIKKNNIKYDLKISNETIDESVEVLRKFIK